ncbi:hypothetical protein [Microbispora sp. NPDC049125]|uniref:hypothetical protein n=1 Tax=Microbispora sp. NPDC049125 TaxID=3154929 RepID=UPI003467B114
MNKALTYILTALLAGLMLVLAAPAASAHNGAIKLEVTGDGDHNVNVLATYKKDGHPVTEIVVATLVATSADGRSFGPVPLRSSPEGQNLYHAADPLPAGEWKVTVKATEPTKASKTVTVKAGAITLPQSSATGQAASQEAAADGTSAASAQDAEEAGDSAGMPLKIGIIVVAAVIAVAGWIVLARRRSLYTRR